MKVYKIEFEVDKYQSLLASGEFLHECKLLALDGSPKRDVWPKSLAAELENENASSPDIFSLGAGNLVLHGRALEVLEPFLLPSFEFLPVHWESGKGFCINPTKLSECIDSENSIWCVDDDSGKKLFIEEYVFTQSKIPETIIFKDSGDCFELFTTDGIGSMKSLVDEYKITGINFELLWEN